MVKLADSREFVSQSNQSIFLINRKLSSFLIILHHALQQRLYVTHRPINTWFEHTLFLLKNKFKLQKTC